MNATRNIAHLSDRATKGNAKKSKTKAFTNGVKSPTKMQTMVITATASLYAIDQFIFVNQYENKNGT